MIKESASALQLKRSLPKSSIEFTLAGDCLTKSGGLLGSSWRIARDAYGMLCIFRSRCIAPQLLPATWFKPYGLSHDSDDFRCGIEDTCH